MRAPLRTERLLIRDWATSDTETALDVYGVEEVSRWLTPDMTRLSDLAAMRSVLRDWAEAQPDLEPPRGRWALVRQAGDQVIGGLMIRALPPDEEDLEIGWQLRPDTWGHGIGALGECCPERSS